MELLKISNNKLIFFILFSIISRTQSATIKDIFNLNSPENVRVERDSQYYNRYGAATGQTSQLRPIKPEESPEARENDKDNPNVEKRCTRCDYNNRDSYRNPYDSRTRYDDRYDDSSRYRLDRYDDRYRDRYDDYERRPYETDRRYLEYDRKYDDRSGYDRYYDRDRYERRPEYYDRYNDRDRYDKDDKYRYYERNYDRYDRGYRPYDETTRGSAGFDGNGRGYYFATGRPEYGGYGGYGGGGGSGGGGGYGSGYASNWNYGGKRDYNRDSDRNWRDQGFSSGSNRPRDPYDPWYNRGTSYLYGRPSSSTTTQPPSPSGDTTVTSNSQLLDNTSSG